MEKKMEATTGVSAERMEKNMETTTGQGVGNGEDTVLKP